MTTGCFKPAHREIQSSKAGSRLVFSSEQTDRFRQIAQEARQAALSAKSAKRASTSTGLLPLFSGSSGTGKTMAAEVIARELRTNLYRVNLNQVVSKYIGETEKNFLEFLRQPRKGGPSCFLMRLMPYWENEVRCKIVMTDMRILK